MASLAASGAPALMTVFRNDGRWDGSNVAFADGRIRLYDKHGRHPALAPHHLASGLLPPTRYLVPPAIPARPAVDRAQTPSSHGRAGRLARPPSGHTTSTHNGCH